VLKVFELIEIEIVRGIDVGINLLLLAHNCDMDLLERCVDRADIITVSNLDSMLIENDFNINTLRMYLNGIF
jgi:hypothetical protein